MAIYWLNPEESGDIEDVGDGAGLYDGYHHRGATIDATRHIAGHSYSVQVISNGATLQPVWYGVGFSVPYPPDLYVTWHFRVESWAALPDGESMMLLFHGQPGHYMRWPSEAVPYVREFQSGEPGAAQVEIGLGEWHKMHVECHNCVGDVYVDNQFEFSFSWGPGLGYASAVALGLSGMGGPGAPISAGPIWLDAFRVASEPVDTGRVAFRLEVS